MCSLVCSNIPQETQADEEKEDNTQQEQSQQQPEKDIGERMNKQTNTQIKKCEIRTELGGEWDTLIITVCIVLFFFHLFPAGSPSMSQSEHQEELKEESCSEKKPDDVCLCKRYLNAFIDSAIFCQKTLHIILEFAF